MDGFGRREDVAGAPHRVMVCLGARCRAAGSEATRRTWRRHADGLGGIVLATSCLGQCRAAPVVVIYPMGVWLGGQRGHRIKEAAARLATGRGDWPGLMAGGIPEPDTADP
jgi:NADH:ubiquinone oxidoreductase subunit E